jgi:hypothetical protein
MHHSPQASKPIISRRHSPSGFALHRGREILRSLLICILLTGTVGTFCNAQSPSRSKCGNSTVEDAYGPEIASQAKAFFAKIQNAIRNDDKQEFASLIHYPLHVYSSTGDRKIKTAAELMRRYPAIINFAAKQEVLAQSPDCLFANGQGMMVGNGAIWFAQQNNAQMKIITINVLNSKGRS